MALASGRSQDRNWPPGNGSACETTPRIIGSPPSIAPDRRQRQGVGVADFLPSLGAS